MCFLCTKKYIYRIYEFFWVAFFFLGSVCFLDYELAFSFSLGSSKTHTHTHTNTNTNTWWTHDVLGCVCVCVCVCVGSNKPTYRLIVMKYNVHDVCVCVRLVCVHGRGPEITAEIFALFPPELLNRAARPLHFLFSSYLLFSWEYEHL